MLSTGKSVYKVFKIRLQDFFGKSIFCSIFDVAALWSNRAATEIETLKAVILQGKWKSLKIGWLFITPMKRWNGIYLLRDLIL